jgi:pyruvate dehydrogenase E2 component (dihydrolipoyllysine-residue acetyltransferase)
MSVSVTMPRLGESVTEGTVTRWLKHEGDHVEADEPLLEVSTDKVDTEVPSPASGVLTSIKVQEDETVDIGVELAVIGDADGADSSAPAVEESPAEPEPEPEPESAEAPPSEPDRAPAAAAPPQPAAPARAEAEVAAQPQMEAAAPTAQAPAPAQTPSKAQAPPPAQAPAQAPPPAQAPAPMSAEAAPEADADEDEVAGTYVTPLVRRLASENGVDLSAVTGTGVGGRIRKSDVLAAAERTAEAARDAEAAERSQAAQAARTEPAGTGVTAPVEESRVAAGDARGRVEKMSRRRQLIAARMVESLQVSAQLTTVVEVDVTTIARLRERAKADFQRREGVKLTFLPFFAAALVEALKVHPVLNSSIDLEQKTITFHGAEHLGIAVDTEAGLTVPVIHNAGDLNLAGLARKIADLAERTRSNKISPDELGGGTFTLTNTGSRGALFDTPIINQPQVGILGTGTVVKRPVVISDPNLGETIAVRSMVYLALSYDHRIVDGADAARFLGTIKERLEGGNFERALGLS